MLNTTSHLAGLINLLQDIQTAEQELFQVLQEPDPKKRARKAVDLHTKLEYLKGLVRDLTPEEQAFVKPILIEIVKTLLIEAFEIGPQHANP